MNGDKEKDFEYKRRLKRIFIDPKFIVGIFTQHKHEYTTKINSELPSDVEIVGIDFKLAHNAFEVVLRHKSFEYVPIANIIPIYTEITFEVIEEDKK